MPHEHRIWIERFSDMLGIPVWAGVLVLSGAAYAVYAAAYLPIGEFVFPFGILDILPVVLLALAIPVYVRRKMTALENHALSMVEDPRLVADKISALSSLRPLAVVFFLVFAGFALPYYAQPLPVSGLPAVLLLLPWIFPVFVVATAFWTWSYSMVGIYRIGKLPMKLRSFAHDRTLGLRPFASTCLGLTAVFYLFTILTAFSDPGEERLAPFFLLRSSILVLVGLVLFFLPLLSIHDKLLRAKAKESSWINERYVRALDRVRSADNGPIDPSLQAELLAIDKLQKDIQSIRSWPFDTNSLTRLVTIILSTSAILLSRVLAGFLGI